MLKVDLGSRTRGGEEVGGNADMLEAIGSPSAPSECGYVDVDQVQTIEWALLRTLAAACMEKTTGDMFKRPMSVAADVKREMIDYLRQQTESYSSEIRRTMVMPSKIVNEFLDGFVRSKRNLFGFVSSKIMFMEKSDEKIEEVVSELDRAGVWMIGQRETFAKTLVRKLDKSKTYHCEVNLLSAEELGLHKSKCSLRPVICENQGCESVFSVRQGAEHDASCPFKLLPCKQECDAKIMRSEMIAHCGSVCPMKMVNCPFSTVGCTHVIPQGTLEQHCSTLMGPHLLYLLHAFQSQEGAVESQGERLMLLEKAFSLAQRSEAVDIGSVQLTVKEQEAKMKKLEQEIAKLRRDLKAANVSGEVTQLREEVRSLKK
ncbi:hypothetical protein O6H91_21G037300 [Diphasiastrum complanatum]|uniref:Uncharacterized protein n=4 Tax=Diphasiastrum complanatum TaxID=34168 RepID=A0ACC2AJT3_DIPCM|nr:hypothetical protein O6H91_21G036800 [Diphasiastrum complanatum]KAJ7517712.1 hypothetical protein O6H91_21G036800 [Diphasiastrum complanatum]KAJ7517718.1 hypothetical protein O6H91_21G037300 [Diphasiastrum complanatum]KAJ7517719.1 hypothetical protein O6H91_21G037300 [Diphasiastrum complanatum]